MTGDELADQLHGISREVFVRDHAGRDLAVLRIKMTYGQPVRLIVAIPVDENGEEVAA